MRSARPVCAPWRRAVVVAAVLFFAWGAPPRPAQARDAPVARDPALARADLPEEACRRAAAAAERQADLPSGLLLAIGQIESGRRDPQTGRVAPWPWTIDRDDGAGQMFDSRAEAVAATRSLEDNGMRSIDVGCFQVNLAHHPEAFASLEEAFEPEANAAYAARFLAALHARTGSWEDAVAAYHSADPQRGSPYRDRVLAAWASQAPASDAVWPPLAPPTVRTVVWTPSKAGQPIGIWSPSARGFAPTVISIRLSADATRPMPAVDARGSMPPEGR